MNFFKTVFVCLVATLGVADADQKVEVKYAIFDLMQLPAPILSSLKTGQDHPDIIRRGYVVQEYLAVTQKNITDVFAALKKANIPLGSNDSILNSSLEYFVFPGKTQEIRLMQKCIKENGVVKDIYQISLFGPGGTSCAKIETAPITGGDILAIQHIFNEFRHEVTAVVKKVFFELVFGSNTIEVDIFLRTQESKLIPTFIVGEIKFLNSNTNEAQHAAFEFRQNKMMRPVYFGTDCTDDPRCKARNIAIMDVPAKMLAAFADFRQTNQFFTSKIIQEYNSWASSSISHLVGEALVKLQGTFLDKKVLLNAEAFGFGPTAAIAEIFPYLRDRIGHMGYIGSGHTLDLQSKLPYDTIYDLGQVGDESKKAKFLSATSAYDVFITASDFEAAAWAKSLGLQVIIYDPLTWYWHTLPEVIAKVDYYVAQNFFGVFERLQTESRSFPEHTVVPAIISGLERDMSQDDENILLVNMGGLSNPHVQNEDLISYAKVVLASIHEGLEPAFAKTHYVSSKAIAIGVKDVCPVASMLPHQVQKILNSCKLAIMTSGLGNIFEASTMQKHVVWLPPANDSQGQQCILLKEHGMVDFAIDWHEILEDEQPINYFAEQQQVLKQIGLCMQKLALCPQAQAKLKQRLVEVLEQVQKKEASEQKAPAKLSKLAQTFEVGGAKNAAESILQFLKLHP